MFNKDETRILSWSSDGTALMREIEVDDDFPNKHLSILVEAITGTSMDDYGNVIALDRDKWKQSQAKYLQIAGEHLKTCKHKTVNIYAQAKNPPRRNDVLPTQLDAEELLNKAISFHDAGDLEQAFALYTNVIEIQPNNVDAYWRRGSIFLEQNLNKEASVDYRNVTKLAPNFADGYGGLGWALILQGKITEALEPCLKSFRLAPDIYAWAVNLGHIALLVGDSESAYKLYKKALLLIQSEQELHEGPLADFSLFIEKNWENEACKKAKNWFEKSFLKLQESKKLKIIYDQLITEEKHKEALPFVLKDLELKTEIFGKDHESNLSSLDTLAGSYEAIGHYAKAENLYDQALQISENVFGKEHQDTFTFMIKLALVYETQGKNDEAKLLLLQAAQIGEKVLGVEEH
jgi:tetratricopeptide (TPR) repeat protein